MGIPMITNAHSDLGEYVRDGVEGLIVDCPSAASFASALQRARSMRREDVLRLGQNARRRAAECFDYRRYVEPLGNFVEKAIGATGGRGRW